MTLHGVTAAEWSRRLAAGKISAVELTQASLHRIAAVDSRVGAFLGVMTESALEQAVEIDRRRAAGEALGPLAGIPIAVKDVLCTKGAATTCGSKMLQNFVPPYDAAVVERLKAAGAVIVGKTNMDEFAMGGSTENSALGKTRNPWDLTRVPGGSSGGAAAAVAGQMATLSIGTDTGGSIRQPAAFCGITGLKPTYGRVSRYGLVAFSSSLDQIGPMAWTAEDCALLLEAIAGPDARDSTALPAAVPHYAQELGKPLAGLKLGVAKEFFEAGLDSEVEAAVREALRVYQSLGATVKEITLPHSKYAIAVYYLIAPCEASSNLARYDGVHYGHRTERKAMDAQLKAERAALKAADDVAGEKNLDTALVRLYRNSRSEGFGPEVKRRIMLGTFALSSGYKDAYYLKAMKVRRLIRQDYDKAFQEVDLIVGPCTPTAAFKAGEKVDDPLAMYLGDLYTVSTNLAGVGGISLPCGLTKGGLPIGLQLQGAPLAESLLLQAAHLFQTATDWHARRPDLS